MTGEEFLFARRILQRKWLPRDVVGRCLSERRSKAGRERDVPLWDLFVERKLLTPSQARQILLDAGDGESRPAVPGIEVLETVAQDPLGARHRARRLKDNRPVEVRIVPPPLATNPAYRRRFLADGAALAALGVQPGLVRVLGVGELGEALYRVSEPADGQTAADLLLEADALDEDTCLTLVAQAADVLALLHGKRIPHGGIEPDTLLLSHEGGLVLREPALAPANAEEAALPEGAVMTSPAYRSPDRLAGRAGAGFADDVHALGASFYHLAVGQPPYPGDTAEDVAHRILAEEPPDARAARAELSYGFSVMLWHMMARDPGDRFPDPRALRNFVERVRKGRVAEPAPAEPSGAPSEEGGMPPAAWPPGRPAARGSRRRRGPSRATLALCAGLFLATLAVLAWFTRPVSAPSTDPGPVAGDSAPPANAPVAVPPGDRDPVAQEAALAARPWRSLFDGRSAHGWRLPGSHWRFDARSGVLTLAGDRGEEWLTLARPDVPRTGTRQFELVATVGQKLRWTLPTRAGDLQWTLESTGPGSWHSEFGWGAEASSGPNNGQALDRVPEGRWTLLVTVYADRRAAGLWTVDGGEVQRWDLPFPQDTLPGGHEVAIAGVGGLRLDRVRVRECLPR